MSVEALVIAGLVEEQSPKKALQAGFIEEDFEIYDEEFKWLLYRAERRKPITRRVFKEKFPDFEFLVSTEKLPDLLDELKQERAFVTVNAALENFATEIEPENAIEKAATLREILGDVLKTHTPASD